MRKHSWFLIIVFTFLLSGCHRKSFGMYHDSIDVQINRFDSVLYQWIDSNDPVNLQELLNDYPQMLGLLGKSLFRSNDLDSAVFFEKLRSYFSEPTLKSLYQDALVLYASNSPVMQRIKNDFAVGFERLGVLFPSIETPRVYMHVSGLQQNVIVADGLLSISIDKYLSADYLLYKKFFYEYQIKHMTPERVAIDGLYAWITSDFPFRGHEAVLLEKMVYEGKIIYLLMQTGLNYPIHQLIPMTEHEYQWCLKNESALWKTVIDRKHLLQPNPMITSRYFNPAPSTFITEDAPGYLGRFIGFRIIENYMKQTKSTCQDLMLNNDAEALLKKSKYKP